MARPRNAPPKPPDEDTPADTAPEPAAFVAASERDDGDDEPRGRASTAGAPRPVVKTPTPAGRRTGSAFVEGRKVSPSLQTDDVIRIKASENPNFILTHDPARWGYHPKSGRILPDFGRIRLVPGIGRVDARGRPDGAIADALKCGRAVIFDRDVPGGYLREFDMIGGVGFLPAWERVKVSGKHAMIAVDDGAYEAFADSLVAKGTIEPPNDVTIAQLRDSAVNMIRLSEPRKTAPSVAAEIAMYEGQIAACDRLLEGAA